MNLTRTLAHYTNWWWNEYESVPSQIIISSETHTHTHIQQSAVKHSQFFSLLLHLLSWKLAYTWAKKIPKFTIEMLSRWECMFWQSILHTTENWLTITSQHSKLPSNTLQLLATRPHRFVCSFWIVLGVCIKLIYSKLFVYMVWFLGAEQNVFDSSFVRLTFNSTQSLNA